MIHGLLIFFKDLKSVPNLYSAPEEITVLLPDFLDYKLPHSRVNTGYQLHLRQQTSPVGLLWKVYNHILPIGAESCEQSLV